MKIGTRTLSKSTQHNVFDSIAQCASATGCPVAILRHAKRDGCPAFRHGRIFFTEFIPWFFENYLSDSQTDWAVEYKKAQTRQLHLRIAKEEGESVDVDDVLAQFSAFNSYMVEMLRQKLENEWPAEVHGSDIPTARKIGKQTVDSICAQFRTFCSTWKPDKPS